MNSSFILVLSALCLLLITSTFGHSQMRCAKYDVATGNCLAPIRNQAVSFESEANDMANGGGVCQSPLTTPISDAYSNGKGCPDYAPCPLPMGTFSQGENFTIMWLARNHAVADQTPGNIELYLSPVESMNQGVETSVSVFQQNKFCTAPFISCNGQNGNLVQCYATCRMPQNAGVGIHTLWWKWTWPNHNSVYTTCADINVKAATSGSAAPTPVTPTPVPTTPTPVTTAAKPSTTPVTTAAKPTVPAVVTTARPSTPSTPSPVPTPTVPSPVSGKCEVEGDQVCTGSNTYSTCSRGRTSNIWVANQPCSAGSSCRQSKTDNKIRCY